MEEGEEAERRITLPPHIDTELSVGVVVRANEEDGIDHTEETCYTCSVFHDYEQLSYTLDIKGGAWC